VRGVADILYFSVIVSKLHPNLRDDLDIEVRCIPYSGASRYAHFCRERVKNILEIANR